MPIVPDDKNWTWVLQRPCPECGFDASALAPGEIAPALRFNAEFWVSVLAEPSSLLRQRRSDDRWSPLEYACHVRDVFFLFRERLELMLTMDNPTYPNWDQDRTAIDDCYNDQEIPLVAQQITDAAAALADCFEEVRGAAWDRTGSRSDGAHFTVTELGRYLVHDPMHHEFDVRQDLPNLSEQPDRPSIPPKR